jgi:putative pyruvate formate lyase activating enzyme
MGRPVSRDEFVSICLALQDAGALNVNIVTGSHAIPALAEGLEAAKGAGLSIPVCWNSSAYESPQALAVIAPLVDIWLPDLKSLDSGVCAGIFNAPDYPEAAAGAILFMLASSPLRFAPDGESLLGGVIVRHLFLPGLIEGTAAVLDWLKAHAASRALISLMTQYTPMPGAPSQGGPPVFEDRFVSPREAQDLRDLVDAYGFEEVFFQELLPGSEWLPDFRRPQPFSSALARPLWHWSTGFIRA